MTPEEQKLVDAVTVALTGERYQIKRKVIGAHAYWITFDTHTGEERVRFDLKKSAQEYADHLNS